MLYLIRDIVKIAIKIEQSGIYLSTIFPINLSISKPNYSIEINLIDLEAIHENEKSFFRKNCKLQVEKHRVEDLAYNIIRILQLYTNYNIIKSSTHPTQ